MSPNAFRGLIVCSVLFAVAAGVVDALCPSLIPQSVVAALEKETATSIFETNPFAFLAFSLPWLIAVLASTIGLLFFKPWARPMALYSTLFGFISYSFLSPELSSPVASALTEASAMTWGAILALAYYSPLRENFIGK